MGLLRLCSLGNGAECGVVHRLIVVRSIFEVLVEIEGHGQHPAQSGEDPNSNSVIPTTEHIPNINPTKVANMIVRGLGSWEIG